MKKLILLLLFIPLVSCDSTENNKLVYPLDDLWVVFKTIEGDSVKYFNEKALLNDKKDLDWVTFLSIDNMSIKLGYFDYNQKLKTFERKPLDDLLDDANLKITGYTFKDNKRDSMIYLRSVDGIKYSSVSNIKFLSKDTLIRRTHKIDSSGTVIKVDIADYFFRLPLYSSSEARDILTKKKNDLDLQLITQKQYDSIKNKLSRYISD
jgi:hypothetical protein